MKIHLTTSSNNITVPFEYQKTLAGTLHKWIGKNDIHDQMSLYSYSWLKEGFASEGGLIFPKGAKWIISTHDNNLLKKIISGIQNDPSINYGMNVQSITIQEKPTIDHTNRFMLYSPIFIKRNINGNIKHYLYHDAEADMLMTETLKNKLRAAGLDEKHVEVSFDKSYRNPKSKLVTYNGVECKTSMCPIIIKGSEEQLTFAWNVGIGNSTGIGFGALK